MQERLLSICTRLGCCITLGAVPLAAIGQDSPNSVWNSSGVESTSPTRSTEKSQHGLVLRPGKVDAHYARASGADDGILMIWTPAVKGGLRFGVSGDQAVVIGGYFRPPLPWSDSGELILGGQYNDLDGAEAYEIQGEYRFPMGLGVGAGFVELPSSDLDVLFGKLSFRARLESWQYILAFQVQSMGDRTRPGAYVAVFESRSMLVAGYDGEQWRTTFGFASTNHEARWSPAVEVLWVDNSVGDLSGPKILFANATLGFRGGFLSHPARLGRAMGPTGLEFGNPLGFIQPTWNRRLNVWELGGMAGFRISRIQFPNGAVDGKYEGLIFPFQVLGLIGAIDGIFVGGYWADRMTGDSPGMLGGILMNIGRLHFGGDAEYDADLRQPVLNVGIIYRL